MYETKIITKDGQNVTNIQLILLSQHKTYCSDLESKPTMPEPEVEKPPPPEKQPKSSQKKAEKKVSKRLWYDKSM